jgi:hypothetical protein
LKGGRVVKFEHLNIEQQKWESVPLYMDIDLLYELKESQPVKRTKKQAKGELVSIGRK